MRLTAEEQIRIDGHFNEMTSEKYLLFAKQVDDEIIKITDSINESRRVMELSNDIRLIINKINTHGDVTVENQLGEICRLLNEIDNSLEKIDDSISSISDLVDDLFVE